MNIFVKHTVLLLAIVLPALPALSQKYMTRTGRISFFSATPLENIEAINNEAAAVLDSKTGAVSFQVPVKSFRFEKRLMQDHFNEDYMESDTYPKASFSGQISGWEDIDFSKDGSYQVKAAGTLVIHGVSRTVTLPGTISLKEDVVTIYCKFGVKPADHKIRIPSLVSANIAEEIEVTVNTILKKI